jgi:hypothetical protein
VLWFTRGWGRAKIRGKGLTIGIVDCFRV